MPSREHDREILRLALPALGALAAEPLYLLVDTAIVGHLGTTQLAALALAATVLASVVALCNFLAYGTTAQVARLHGAGGRGRRRASWRLRRCGWRSGSASCCSPRSARRSPAADRRCSAADGDVRRRRALPADLGARAARALLALRRPGLAARRRRPAHPARDRRRRERRRTSCSRSCSSTARLGLDGRRSAPSSRSSGWASRSRLLLRAPAATRRRAGR